MNSKQRPDIISSDAHRTRYSYELKSLDNIDGNAITLLIGCMCGKPTENYPFQQPVFTWLKISRN